MLVLSQNAAAPLESIAFHCQQHVEKLLKAFLTLHGIESPRTHDIRRLVQLAVPNASELSELECLADLLTEQAVAMRYPDEWREIDAEETQQLVESAKKFSGALLPKLTAAL